MQNLLTKMLKDAGAATAIEYAFIAALISIAAVTLFASIGTSVSNMFGSVSNGM